MRQRASQRPLMMRHAKGQCSPAQAAAEEMGQPGNREGTSRRPLMMRHAKGQCSPAQAAVEEATRAIGGEQANAR